MREERVKEASIFFCDIVREYIVGSLVIIGIFLINDYLVSKFLRFGRNIRREKNVAKNKLKNTLDSFLHFSYFLSASMVNVDFRTVVNIYRKHIGIVRTQKQ